MAFWQRIFKIFGKRQRRVKSATSLRHVPSHSILSAHQARVDSFMRDFIKHPYWVTDNDPPDLEVVTSKSDRRWYKNGVLHRDDAPAIVGHNGRGAYEEWYQNGLRHRDGGPAVLNDMFEKWYQHGKLHREDGPAKFRGDIYGGVYVYKEWFRGGRLHREDGPAYEGGNQRRWYRHGKLHRTDGPAIEDPPFVREYWIDGKPHRTDGPAVINKREFLEAWYIDGHLHREGAPAVCKGDTQIWSWRGRLHREDGPAVCIGLLEKISARFCDRPSLVAAKTISGESHARRKTVLGFGRALFRRSLSTLSCT